MIVFLWRERYSIELDFNYIYGINKLLTCRYFFFEFLQTTIVKTSKL